MKSKSLTCNVPKLRFPEFLNDGEWEEKKLSSIYTFKVTNSFSRDKLNYDSGLVKNIHYGDIHTKFSTLFDVQKENVPFINSFISLDNIKDENYCQESDMVFADASEDLEDVGKSIEIINLNNEKLLSGLHTLLARQKENKFITGFGGYLFKSNKIREQIKKESQGTKVLSISGTRLANIDICFPLDKKEQQKIAECLSSLDALILAQSSKVEALKAHKKALMQQLFPIDGETTPRLRFPEFQNDGEWEEKNGNVVFEQISNKKHNSDIPILAITQEYGAIPREMIDYNVAVMDKSIEAYKVVEINDFIISLRSFQGGIEHSEYKGICSPAYIILRKKIDIKEQFFKYYFKTYKFIQDLNKNLEGIRDGKMVSYKQFSDLLLPLPSNQEQQKIAECLSSLDALISAQSSKVEALKQHKKALMQQLFPTCKVTS